MEYCNIFIAEYQYNQHNNNIIVPSAGGGGGGGGGERSRYPKGGHRILGLPD